jgi:SAM-dependent methyltransferase
MHAVMPMLVLAAIGFSGFHLYHHARYLSQDARALTRNFYATLRVKDTGTGDEAMRRLIHGVIMHGEQYLAESKRRTPTTYYSPTSGVGRALKALESPELRVGVVGLGTGTLAAYGRPGNVFRFYEINPQVVDIARQHFTFLGDSPARIEIELGDARLTMEREAPQRYDLLAIDAFSSDSIPVHLLTREAMAVYLRHLKPGGVIAFHVTNRFLDLAPVVKRIAGEHRLHVALLPDDEGADASSTDWVLVARDKGLLDRPELARFRKDIGDIPGLRVWTDDFSNLFQILK